MADRLRVVDFAYGGRPFGVLDLEQVDLPGGVIMKERDSFTITPGQPRDASAQSSRRFGGSRPVGQSHDNGSVAARWLVKGPTKQGAIDTFNAFADACMRAKPGRYIEWRPDGAPYSTYYELRGTATWNPNYKWVDWAGTGALYVEATWPVAPLGEMDRMDIVDDWSTDTLAAGDYAGVATGLTVAGGVLAAGTTSSRTLVHTARGHGYRDGQVTQRVNVGATVTTWSHRVGLQSTADGQTYLYAQITQAGTLAVGHVDAGTATNFSGSVAAGAPAANSTGWLRYRREGNVLFAEWFTSPPTPMSTPAATATYTLTAAEQATYAAGGFAVMRIAAGDATTFTYGNFEVLPYVYRARTLPEVIAVPGVPGSQEAPARVSVHATHSGGAAAPAWALLGWWRRPGGYSLVWNGDFADDVNGWPVAAQDNVAVPTSIARVADPLAASGFAAEVVTPAVINTGASFRMYRRFRRGVTYTVSFDVWAPSSTTLVDVVLGVTGDAVATPDVALAPARQTFTRTWVPAADTEYAVAGARTRTATATTFRISNVQVYEGTVAPTPATQQQGRGAAPALGILQAEAADTGDLVGWAIAADANYRRGQGLKVTASGAGTAAAQWLVDPSLVEPDDFADCEVDVEVWARVELASTLVSPKLTASARPEAGTAFGAERTADLGARLLTLPSSGTAFRTVRLGVLTLPVTPRQPGRLRLRLAASWAGGSSGTFGVDELVAVPLRRRAALRTGTALDATYPRFVQSTAETTKIMRDDGRGAVAKPPGAPSPDPGLGRPLELQSGDCEVVLALSSLVPDDPTASAASEQRDHSATVHFEVVPRVPLARGS